LVAPSGTHKCLTITPPGIPEHNRRCNHTHSNRGHTIAFTPVASTTWPGCPQAVYPHPSCRPHSQLAIHTQAATCKQTSGPWLVAALASTASATKGFLQLACGGPCSSSQAGMAGSAPQQHSSSAVPCKTVCDTSHRMQYTLRCNTHVWDVCPWLVGTHAAPPLTVHVLDALTGSCPSRTPTCS
jgi:hypothetical protein